MSELDPMDLNCSSFMTIFNSCLALCSSFLQPCSQSWSTGSRYQHLMIVFMHPSKDFSIIKDVKPNSPSRHYMNTCRQEEEHGVLVGHLLDQPHVMRQEGLVALVPAPTPKYKRQVANFSTSSAFVFFQVRIEKETSDCCACHSIISAQDNPRTSRLKCVGNLAAGPDLGY